MTQPDNTNDGLRYCRACQRPLPPDATLCSSCGRHLNYGPATDETDRLPPLIRIPMRVCRKCGFTNIPERRICKCCQASLPRVTYRYERELPSGKMELPQPVLYLIAAGMIILLIYNIVFPSSPALAPFSLESTISRANRVIAIDDPDMPSYRWVITSPADSTVVGEHGTYAKHQPAQISYGTEWTKPSSVQDIGRGTNLSEEEWQQIKHWQETWCYDRASHQQVANERSIYIIAMRCTGYTATIFRVSKTSVPAEIVRLLERASL